MLFFRPRRNHVAGLLLALAPFAVEAQTAVPAAAGDDGLAPADPEGDIVVTGERQRGAVVGDIAPDQQLGPAEIRSYGVSSLADLLTELSPQTTSGRGRGESPVVLLNGHRISGMSEIRDVPVEAISRVDILPEEVALKYGYKADSKVINIVLRPRFRAVTGELAGRTSTEGGGHSGSAETTLLRINKDGRFNLALNYQPGSALLDSQRSVTETQPRRPYDLVGNVTAPLLRAGQEIDPELSALAGQVVTVAGVPLSATSAAPPLGAFVATANDPNVTNLARHRTLVPETRQASINAVLNRNFGSVGATANARVQYNDSVARLGLATTELNVPQGNPFSPFGDTVAIDRYLDASQPLEQRTRTTAAHLGLTFDGSLASWRWSVTSNLDRTETRTLTDRGIDTTAIQAAILAGDPTLNPFGPLTGLGNRLTDRATSTSTIGDVDLLLSGSLFDLPAGAVSTSFQAGFTASDFSGKSQRAGIEQSSSNNRTTTDGQVNIDIPLTSRRQGVLPVIGDLSLNANVAVDHLSDFGTLTTLGYGLHWTPVKAISLVVSATDEDNAPTSQQLGNPAVFTTQVPVFDYQSGTTVDITRVTGGNPGLLADNRRVLKIGLTLKPFSKADLTLTANYVSSKTRDAISAFPSGSVTPEIEAAFPDRFVRDAAGQLLRIDARPVNFQREESSELRWGINFSKPLKSASQDRLAALRAARPPEGARPRGAGAEPGARPDGPGRGPRGGRGPGGGGGRLQFALYHTWHLRDQVLIRDGVPVLDLLNGSATGSSGGQPRHELEAQAGYSKDGIGVRLGAKWQSGTTVDGTVGRPASQLEFGSLATADLRLFTDFGQIPEFGRKHPWLRGARLSLSLINLLDTRQRVVDGFGVTPASYQPDRLNPLGRTVRISFRKLFF